MIDRYILANHYVIFHGLFNQPVYFSTKILIQQPMIVNCYCYLKFLFLSFLNICLQILAQLIICTGSFYSQNEIILLTILPINLSLLFTSVCIYRISLNSFVIPRQFICLTMGSLADKMSIVQPLL